MLKNGLLIGLCVCLLSVLGGGVYYIIKLQKSIDQLSGQQQLLQEGITKVQSISASKRELESFASSLGLNLETIRKDLKGVDGRLSLVGSAVAKIEGRIEINKPSSNIVAHDPPPQPKDCKLCDIYSYTANTQKYPLNIWQLPVGEISFDASKNNPWSLEQYPLNIELALVLSEDKYSKTTAYGMMVVRRTDKSDLKMVLPIDMKILSINKPEKKWHWWAPHLDLSLDNNFRAQLTPYKFGVSLGFSMCAYGRTLNDNSWRLARIGIGLDSSYTPNISVHPVQYNIGEWLPLLSDAWLSVGLTYNLDLGIVLSLGTTL